MKKVIFGDALKQVMEEAINMLGDAVSSTLGPSGNNVLISNDEMSPFITNDGVTIASSIASENKEINTVLEIAKEAALKTNELVGDGTTTTILLMQSIFNEGLKKIKSGKDTIVLKQELDKSIEFILNELDNFKIKPTKENLAQVGKTSCNDSELGILLTELFLKMNNKYAIKLDESNTEETKIVIKKGYSVELDNISNMYFVNDKELNLNDAYILILKGYLDDLEKISDIINEGIKDKNIVIFVEDASENIKEEMISYFLEYHKNIFLFNLPDYASRRYSIINDLINVTKAKAKNVEFDNISFDDLGFSSKVIINENEILISIDNNLDNYLASLKNELNSCFNDYEKEFLAKRVSSLEKGMATIYVGASTKTEMKDKKMRIEDAINALDVASRGVAIGSGIPFLKISNNIKLNTDADDILSIALKEPFKKIIANCGEDYTKIETLIVNSNYKRVYNFKTKTLEDTKNITVLDPIEVLKVSLKNAVSIASMLLTTNYLVINEREKEETNYL